MKLIYIYDEEQEQLYWVDDSNNRFEMPKEGDYIVVVGITTKIRRGNDKRTWSEFFSSPLSILGSIFKKIPHQIEGRVKGVQYVYEEAITTINIVLDNPQIENRVIRSNKL